MRHRGWRSPENGAAPFSCSNPLKDPTLCGIIKISPVNSVVKRRLRTLEEILSDHLENKRTGIKCLNALHLKILACALMLCDHIWLALLNGENWEWMTCVGRLAFPIFAFQIAEGFHYTKNFKKYLVRMFIFALISEIPFNLMNSGSVIYLEHQNVMFTFCLSLICMYLLEKAKKKNVLVFIL